jgi:hypothetical protein
LLVSSPLANWSFLLSSSIQSVLSVLPSAPDFMPYVQVVLPDGSPELLVHHHSQPGDTGSAAEQVASSRRLLVEMAATNRVNAAAIISRVRRQVPLPDGTVDGVLLEIEYRGIGAAVIGFALRWVGSSPQLGDAFAVERPLQFFPQDAA